MVFALSGLQGAVLCIEDGRRISLDFVGEDGGCDGATRSQASEDDQESEVLSIARAEAEECCHICVDIPLPGGKTPECTVRQLKVTNISKGRFVTYLSVAALSCPNQFAASVLCSSCPVHGTATRPDRTVVLRI